MLASIRYGKGHGNAALFVRARNQSAQYWDWEALGWVGAESDTTKTFLTEYPDADALESRYQAVITPPTGDVILEYVVAADSSVAGEEPVPTPVDLSPVAKTSDVTGARDYLENVIQGVDDKVQKALGLLYSNSVLDQQTYDVRNRLVTARIRCYDSPANAQNAGSGGLLATHQVYTEYDAQGRVSLFRITG